MSGSKLPAVRPKDVVRALERLGFETWRQKGSHLTLYRALDRRALTIPMHFAKDIPKGTLRTIIREAGLSVKEFVKLLKG
jgi:predicted RNA binding protein YcfA (HicA-like mRNA interferase family)